MWPTFLWLSVAPIACLSIGASADAGVGFDAKVNHGFYELFTLEEGATERADYPGVFVSVIASGPTEGVSPGDWYFCRLRYHGYVFGELEPFISTDAMRRIKRLRPIDVAVNNPVLGDLLKEMRPGDEWDVALPGELAFKGQGRGESVPAGAAIRFRMALVEVLDETSWFKFLWAYATKYPVAIIVFGYLLKRALDVLFGVGAGPTTATSNKVKLNFADEKKKPNDVACYFTVAANGKPIGRMEFTLFSCTYPKTSANFRAFCTQDTKSKRGSYKGSRFHRIIDGFMAQGGDVVNGDGTGCRCIYGDLKTFEDEFGAGYIPHDRGYLLSMANSGPNSNGCQFFITSGKTRPQQHSRLDGKHVVFGYISNGEAGERAVDMVERFAGPESAAGKPSAEITIIDCGQVKSKST